MDHHRDAPDAAGENVSWPQQIPLVESGAFLMMHMTIVEPEIPDGVAVFGSDDATPNEGAMLYFDLRGVAREYRWAVSDNVVTWSRRAPYFSQRMVLTLGADGTTITSQGEMSRDGVTWEPDLQLTYNRVSDAEFDASRFSTC